MSEVAWSTVAEQQGLARNDSEARAPVTDLAEHNRPGDLFWNVLVQQV